MVEALQKRNVSGHQAAFRIVTYNFLSGGSARRDSHWTMLRRRLRPDVILTQESRPFVTRRSSSHRIVWHAALAGRWGSAVAARALAQPIHLRGFKGWVTGAQLDESCSLAGKPVRVFSIHCPARKHGYVRTMHEILDRLRPHMKGNDVLLGGDFNVVAGFRGEDELVRMSKAERTLLDRIVGDFDLLPCWQTANPDRPLAQTLRWTGNRAAPYHCDGIFMPRTWRDRLVSCKVVSGPAWDVLSDHNPVLAVFSKYEKP